MGVEARFRSLLPPRATLLRHYRGLAPLYPALVRAVKLPAADILITSSYAFAHGFQTENEAPQLCYCHSPLRFAWMMAADYARSITSSVAGGYALRGLAAALRAADRSASRRVTRYLAGSRFVAEQIARFYGREARVIHPPVETDRFRPGPLDGVEDYFLFCGRLVEPYKRPGLAIDAFRELPGSRLVIAGDGPALDELRRSAPRNVTFVGQLPDDDLIELMQRCIAAVFPSQDDFGMIPIEVMACGRPVIAYGAGGALETVVPGLTGELFRPQTAHALRDAIRAFDPSAYEPSAIRAHAEGWRVERFIEEIQREVRDLSVAA
jgi:glycosyltransferase involved in cell wall biosynthesis